MNDLIIRRIAFNIGWINGVEFQDMDSIKPIKLRSYNGCLCFIKNNKRIGYKTWKDNSVECTIFLNNDCPF